jgi:hypothetical protein
MNRIIKAAVTAVILLVAVPRVVEADSETPVSSDTVVFETVDAVEVWDKSYLIVMGIRQGQTATQDLQFSLGDPESAERCQKQALLAMDRPGRYLLRLAPDFNYGHAVCRLTRR